MNLTDPSQLSLSGELDERIRRSIRHLQELNTEEMRMEFTHPSDFWHWGADYLGRWICTMGWLSTYTHQDYGVRSVVQDLIQFQNPDGSFGPNTDPHDFQEWFGMGRGLVGLLEYYQIDSDPVVLASAIRLADYYLGHYPENPECMAECYSNGLEGLVLLTRITGESKYLSLARQIAEASVVYQGIRYSAEVAGNGRRTPCAGQVHCQLSTARGLLDLYELTGEERYLKPVVDLQATIANELLWITGGIGFYYFRPEENETCADADWLRLNLQLWRLTGDVRYMHLSERILLNQLYFNQADNGGFCYLRGLQNRAGAVFDACCSHHGPRALYECLRYIFSTDSEGIRINLFNTGSAQLSMGDDPVEVRTSSKATPEHLLVSVEMGSGPDHPFSISVRIPEWTRNATFRLNGEITEGLVQDGYAVFTRTWFPGDRLEVVMPFQVIVQRGETLGKHILNSEVAAVAYGPWVFCLNDSWNTEVRIHLARLILTADAARTFTVRGPDQLVARGVTPENPDARLVFTPLSKVGGIPSGTGRIHTVRSPYYKVWVPCVVEG